MESYAVYVSALLVLWSVARQYDCPQKSVTTCGPPIAEPEGYYDWR